MSTGPTGGLDRVPDALVLVASSALAGSLRRVQDSGWVGPVVVVGDAAEASELARALQADPPRSDPLEPGPSGPVPSGAQSPGPGAGPPEGARRELVLDPDRQLAVSGGRQAHLTPLEYEVLHALLVEPGRVCGYAELTEQVWGTRHLSETAQAHSIVKRVRRKLDQIASPVQVQVVHGVGFRAVVQPAPAHEGGHVPVNGG